MAFFGGGGASVDLASPPAIGNTTPNTGKFTSIETTSNQLITTSTGSFQVGLSGGNALGTGAINFQTNRSGVTYVASGANSVVIGNGVGSGARAIAISSTNSNSNDVTASGNDSISIGCGNDTFCRASARAAVAIGGVKILGGGNETLADGQASIAINASATGTNSVAIGTLGRAALYGQISFGGFQPRAGNQVNAGTTILHWQGTTTNNTQTEIFLGGVASNRATIGANRMFTGTINVGAVMSDSSKAFFSHRTVAIKRDNSNNTALVGSVQAVGTDQNTGSPSWSAEIDADDTNESLRIRVTGATSETVYWRVTAILQELG